MEEKKLNFSARAGTEYPCSAEQMLSHLLPAIAGIKGQNVSVKVEPDNKIKT